MHHILSLLFSDPRGMQEDLRRIMSCISLLPESLRREQHVLRMILRTSRRVLSSEERIQGNSKEGIYTDEWGNEIGDSIDLEPCDYRLDAVDREEYLFTDDYIFEYFDEEGFDTYDH